MLEVRVWFEGDLEDVQCFVRGPVTVGGVDADVYLSTEEGATPLFEHDGDWVVVADDRFEVRGGPQVPIEEDGRVVLRLDGWRIEAAVVDPPDPTWRERSWVGVLPVVLVVLMMCTPWLAAQPQMPAPVQPDLGWACPPLRSLPERRSIRPVVSARRLTPAVGAGWAAVGTPVDHRGPGPLDTLPGMDLEEPSRGPSRWTVAADDSVVRVRPRNLRASAARTLQELEDGRCPREVDTEALLQWFTPGHEVDVRVSRHPYHSQKRLLRVVVHTGLFDGSRPVHEISVTLDPTVVKTWRLLGSRSGGQFGDAPTDVAAHGGAADGHAVMLMELVVDGEPLAHEVGRVELRGGRHAMVRPVRGAMVDLANSWAAARVAEGLRGEAVRWSTLLHAATAPRLRTVIEQARRCGPS